MCPNCQSKLSLTRLIFKQNKPFKCLSCDSKLILDKIQYQTFGAWIGGSVGALGTFTALVLLRNYNLVIKFLGLLIISIIILALGTYIFKQNAKVISIN